MKVLPNTIRKGPRNVHKNALRAIVIGLSLVASLSVSCRTPIIGDEPEWPTGCFRDNDERVREMEVVIYYKLDTDLLRHTVDWIRDVDAECESWRERPWWKFWD